MSGARTIATVGATAMVVAACGGSSPQSGSGLAQLTALTRAAYTSNHQSGYRAELTMQMSSSANPSATVNMNGDASFNIAQRSGSLTMHMTIPGAGRPGLRRITLTELFSHGNIYMRLPASIAGKIPGGKPWLALNIGQLGRREGMPGLSTLMNGSTSNPTSYLQYLRVATATRVNDLGPAVVDGVETEQYGTILDLEKTPAALTGPARAAARQVAAEAARLTGLRYVPVTVWIAPNHLVRQLAMSMTEHIPATGQALRVFMEMNFLNYGPQAAPTLPPAGQVTNLASLIHVGF
jgi:hypothetical protein